MQLQQTAPDHRRPWLAALAHISRRGHKESSAWGFANSPVRDRMCYVSAIMGQLVLLLHRILGRTTAARAQIRRGNSKLSVTTF